ncbi:MAG: hypothetical protein JW969_04930 [Spirochaetales bacterium]|nr:hypothetical protein [Spirochaetales bacterium]
MKVIFRGEEIDIDKKNPVGAGGEAIVVKHGKLAFKIYHVPTKERAAKLADFLKAGFNLPENVAAPIDIVKNRQGKVIGFAMPLAPKCTEFMKLSNRLYRSAEQISTNDIITIFLNARLTLGLLHSSSIIVGDLNDLNILFNAKLSAIFIDVDSYQFAGYPCPVGTDAFIAPELYGKDLSAAPLFSLGTDYYSFAVMLFKSLLLVHPYGGIHKKVPRAFDRIVNRITVFDSEVIYPRIALPPDSLSDDLLDYFNTVFHDGKRPGLSPSVLEAHIKSFKCCPKCGLYFHTSRIKCPGCQKAAPITAVDLSYIISKKDLDGNEIIVEELFKTEGAILYHAIRGNTVAIVEFDGERTTLHLITQTKKRSLKMWDGHARGFRYGTFDHYLTAAEGTDLLVFDCAGEKIKPVAKTHTLLYDDEPVTATSEKFFYRLTDKMLMQGRIQNNEIVEKGIESAMENQTWCAVGDRDLGIGFFRIFSKYHHFVFSERGRYEIDLPPVKGKLIEWDARFTQACVLFLRKTMDQGRTYSHLFLVDDGGNILEQKEEESLNSELLKNIHGKTLSGRTILHPTEAGMIIERNGKLTLRSLTAEYVNAESQLSIFRDGILSVSDKNIIFLRSKQKGV